MLTKKEQLYKNKEPKISNIEREYLNWLHEECYARCFVCYIQQVEWHHVKFKSTDKKNHKRLIPLCSEHHKGKVISPHGTPKQWRETFSMEQQNNFADKIYNIFLESR